MTDTIDRLKSALADRYTIEHELGAGGMATVYLAHDVKHNRKVAVKVLRPDLAAILGAERFLKEIEVTANLQHPHILPLFDSGEADCFLYYVMPYIEGDTLRDKLNREKQLSTDEAIAIARAAASGRFEVVLHARLRQRIASVATTSVSRLAEQEDERSAAPPNKMILAQVLKLGQRCVATVTLYDLQKMRSEHGVVKAGRCDEAGVVSSIMAAMTDLLLRLPTDEKRAEAPMKALPRDLSTAALACQGGDSEACHEVGMELLFRLDDEAARAWFKRGCKAFRHLQSCYQLARLLTEARHPADQSDCLPWA